MQAALKTNHHHPQGHHEHQHAHGSKACSHTAQPDKKSSSSPKVIPLPCRDQNCKIKAAHSHIDPKHDHGHDHKHGESCSHHDHKHDHGHDHHHHHHEQETIWPLEDFLANMKAPQWLREFSLNTSFLAPAFISSELVEKLPMPNFLKSWIAISSMHLLNRGHTKLTKLGLSYLVSGAASGARSNLEGQNSFIQNIPRALATAAIAIIEKFATLHHHGNKDYFTMMKDEASTFIKNLGSIKQWQELLPGLLNIETKVQVVAPLMKMLTAALTENLPSGIKNLVDTGSKILLTSASFVGVDRILESLAKAFYGKDSQIAASFGAACGCCGSPVCAAAATDTAISGTI